MGRYIRHIFITVSQQKIQEEIKVPYSGRGAALHRAVSSSPDKNIDIATRAGYVPNTMYGHFRKPDLSDTIMVKYGKAIPYDFSIEYPELASYFRVTVTSQDKSYEEVRKQLELTQSKYTALLETHNKLLIEYNSVREGLVAIKEELVALKKK